MKPEAFLGQCLYLSKWSVGCNINKYAPPRTIIIVYSSFTFLKIYFRGFSLNWSGESTGKHWIETGEVGPAKEARDGNQTRIRPHVH